LNLLTYGILMEFCVVGEQFLHANTSWIGQISDSENISNDKLYLVYYSIVTVQ
jgi:hypothetical protein